MFVNEEVKEEIKSRNNIVDLIGEYVELKRKGNLYWGLCPFHGEKTPSFSVSEERQSYYCFGCHAGGDVISFVQNYDNIDFQDALKLLADRAGVQIKIENIPVSKKYLKKKRLYEMYRDAAMFYSKCLWSKAGKPGMDYFLERGLKPETIKTFGLGYAPRGSAYLYRYLKKKGYEDAILGESGLFIKDRNNNFLDKFYNRVMFPIVDETKKVIAFGGRIMGSGEPKYLNSPETDIFKKRDNLFNINYAKRYAKENMILCEGYMDVIALYEAGFKNTVASLGTALTTQQAKLIKKYTDELLLIYDSDNAGLNAMEKGWEILRPQGLKVNAVKLEPHKDPDELIRHEGAEGMQQRLEDSENIYYFLVDNRRKNLDLTNPDNVIQLQSYAANLLSKMDDINIREYYIEASSKRYMFSLDLLRKQVNSIGEENLQKDRKKAIMEERKRAIKNDGVFESAQRQMLSWLVDDPGILDAVSGYLEPEDFSDPLLNKFANTIFSRDINKEKITFSDLDIDYENQEEVNLAAAVFQSGTCAKEDSDLSQMLKEFIIRIKKDRLNNLILQSDLLADEEMKRQNLNMQFKIRKQINELKNLTLDLKK